MPVLFLAAGLLLFAASIALIAKRIGLELGLTWALTTLSLVAYGLILKPMLTARAIGHERTPRRTRKMPNAPSGSGLRLTLRLISAGPFYLVCALAISLVIATKPWAQEITRLFTGGLLTPVFWSVGALHATVDASLWRVMLLPVALTLVAGTGYWLL